MPHSTSRQLSHPPHMRTRKSHSKSRFGCLPCKQRRIKCGEEAPTCRNCVHRGVQCSYGLARASGNEGVLQSVDSSVSCSSASPQNGTTQCAPSCLSEPDVTRPQATRLRESSVMVHYMTFTCATLSHGEEDIEIWQRLIPEEAIQHGYLMDGLLALSLLHIAQQNPSSSWEYTAAAIQHQNIALQEYRSALNAITEDNKHALFATSIVISILALALFVKCPDSPVGSPQERVVSLVELPQGIGFINQAAGPSISQGKYRGLFRPFGRHQQLRPSENIAESFGELRKLAGGSTVSPGSERFQTYISGIDSLEGAFSCMEASSYLGPVLAWPTSVSRELLELFKIGDPMAESIFMFYGVLLLYAGDRWWAKDVGASLVEDLAGSVRGKGEQWAGVAQRARTIVASSM